MSDWKNVQYKDGKFQTGTGGGGGASALTDLSDVNVSSPSNGQVLKYNNSTSKWENANESGGGGTVTDVQVDGTSVVNQQGVAEITSPNIPVTDVKVNGTSVVSSKEALIKSYKEVTLAEYQALPSSKTSDGVMYCIKDVGGANQFPPLIYSDEEREVGVWRDGKPLYQKTINIQNPSHDGNWHDIAHGISNPDIFANINGVAYWVVNADTIAHVPIPSRDETNSVNYGVLIRIVGSNLQYAITGYGSTTFSKMSITIQYTKTTDTAGSGTWTTQGGYAHHYSTTEQVVGTWIDGKPLYEKTFTGLSQSIRSKDWNVITGISIPNIKNAINVRAKRLTGDGNLADIGLIEYASNVNSQSVQVNPIDTQTLNYLIVQYTKTTD